MNGIKFCHGYIKDLKEINDIEFVNIKIKVIDHDLRFLFYDLENNFYTSYEIIVPEFLTLKYWFRKLSQEDTLTIFRNLNIKETLVRFDQTDHFSNNNAMYTGDPGWWCWIESEYSGFKDSERVFSEVIKKFSLLEKNSNLHSTGFFD